MSLLLEYDGPAVAAVVCDLCNWQTDGDDPDSRKHALLHAETCRGEEQFQWPRCTWPRYAHSWLDDRS